MRKDQLSVYKIHKRFAPNCFLYQNAHKTHLLICQVKQKLASSPRLTHKLYHTNQLKLSPVSWKFNSPPTKMHAFFCSLPGQKVISTNLCSHSLPLKWSQVIYIHASIKWVWPTSPRSQLSTIPLADNCMMTPVFQIECLFAFQANSSNF